MKRSGFVVRSNEGYWNVVIYDPDVREFFLLDQSLTNLEDGVAMLKEQEATPIYNHAVEEWMRADLSDEETRCIVKTEGAVYMRSDDCMIYHELDGNDMYSAYYRHVKAALD